MTQALRKIVKIDEAKCNGCGLCIPSCKEGAIKIVDGKARLVNDVYCDGLGACLGNCPQDAITIEERVADEFNEEAVNTHLTPEVKPLACGCKGSMVKSIGKKATACEGSIAQRSELTNWPIQLMLVPTEAQYLKGADIVLLADCTAVAYANLHQDIIKNRIVLMACPKLDNIEFYRQKLTDIFKIAHPRTVEVVMMEVPCCTGLGVVAEDAARASGTNLNVFKTTVTIEGKRV